MLFHRDLGGDGLPPLVILHGILGSSRNWQTAGGDLARRYHVFALDLRNQGGSPHSEEMTYDAMVGDVAAWLDLHGLGRAALLGHSMGGKVAMLLACRQPERVERLVVVDIAPKDYSWGGKQRAEFAAMNGLDLSSLRSRAEAEQRLEAAVPDWAMRKFLTTNLERDGSGQWHWTINLAVLTEGAPRARKKSAGAGGPLRRPGAFHHRRQVGLRAGPPTTRRSSGISRRPGSKPWPSAGTARTWRPGRRWWRLSSGRGPRP